MRAVGFHRGGDPPETGDVSDATSFNEIIEHYCRVRNHSLITIFGPQGSDPDETRKLETEELTKQYGDMLSLFTGANGRPALIVIPDSNHLADYIDTFIERLLQLESLNCEVVCASVSYPDPVQNGESLLPLQGRRSINRHNAKEALIAKATQGKVLGKTPYGYGSDRLGNFVSDSAEAEVVRHIFEWYTRGDGHLGALGLRRIASRLNSSGLRTRQGNVWSQVTIQGILQNRTYLGTYNRYGVRIVGSHEPLVDRDIFRKAADIMRQRRPIRKQSQSQEFLLSGLVVCAKCDNGMFGMTRRRSWIQEDGTGVSRTYRYYQCPLRVPRMEKSGGEKHISWRDSKLESYVKESISTLDPSSISVNEEALNDHISSEAVHYEREFTESVREVAQGYGTLQDLREPLEQLKELRNNSIRLVERMQSESPSASELIEEVISGDFYASRRAIQALIKRVRVSLRKAYIETFE